MQYVFYDKHTGRIVHTHSVTYLDETQKPQPSYAAELRKTFAADPFVLSRVTARDAANIDMVEVPDDMPIASRNGKMRVDPKSGHLVKAPSLKLVVDKHELMGDGKDTATIRIQLVDEKGRAVRETGSQIKVSTSRGRLSAQGGVVDLDHGSAFIQLTSVAETVDKVRVRARLIDGVADAASLTLEFV